MLKVGDKAPEFSLISDTKQEISLGSYQGKNVLVLFFPLAFTSVCTQELCATRDNIGTYNSANAAVLAISVDSPFTLAKFKEEQGLNFPLLSDFNKEVARAYGCLYEDFVLGMKGVAKRSAFIVDAHGAIQYAEILESAGDLPNFEAIHETLKRLA